MKPRIRAIPLRHSPCRIGIKILMMTAAMLCAQVGGVGVSAMEVRDTAAGDLHQRVAKATLIVRGTVIAAEGYRQGGQGGIYTEVRFRVTDVIKGSLTDSLLIFDLLGGTVGDQTMTVFGGGIFPKTVGQDAILLLTPKSDLHRLSPRGVPLEVDPLRGGLIYIQFGRVFHDDKVIWADTFAQYLHLLSGGNKISADSLLQSLPRQTPTPRALAPSSSIQSHESGRLSNRADSGVAPEFDSTRKPAGGPSSPPPGEDSVSRLSSPPKSESARPAGPLRPPPGAPQLCPPQADLLWESPHAYILP